MTVNGDDVLLIVRKTDVLLKVNGDDVLVMGYKNRGIVDSLQR